MKIRGFHLLTKGNTGFSHKHDLLAKLLDGLQTGLYMLCQGPNASLHGLAVAIKQTQSFAKLGSIIKAILEIQQSIHIEG